MQSAPGFVNWSPAREQCRHVNGSSDVFRSASPCRARGFASEPVHRSGRGFDPVVSGRCPRHPGTAGRASRANRARSRGRQPWRLCSASPPPSTPQQHPATTNRPQHQQRTPPPRHRELSFVVRLCAPVRWWRGRSARRHRLPELARSRIGLIVRRWCCDYLSGWGIAGC